MKTKKPTAPKKPKPGKTNRKVRSSGLVGRRYSSVEAMMIGEKFPKLIINRVRSLLERDKAIAHAFRQGASINRLSRKHSLPVLSIEDILRYELALHSPNQLEEARRKAKEQESNEPEPR